MSWKVNRCMCVCVCSSTWRSVALISSIGLHSIRFHADRTDLSHIKDHVQPCIVQRTCHENYIFPCTYWNVRSYYLTVAHQCSTVCRMGSVLAEAARLNIRCHNPYSYAVQCCAELNIRYLYIGIGAYFCSKLLCLIHHHGCQSINFTLYEKMR